MAFDWDTWLMGTGIPPMPSFNRVLAEAAESLAQAWVNFDQNIKESRGKFKDMSHVEPPTVNIDEWTSGQKICFLDALLKLLQEDGKGKPKKLHLFTLQQMQKLYGFHKTQNAEILFRYCMIAIQSEDSGIYPTVQRFITTQGRMKYIRPLYRALFASSSGRNIAVDTFLKHKDFYHPIASKMIAYDMTTREQTTGMLGKIKNMVMGVEGPPPTSMYMGVAATFVTLGALFMSRSRK
jgi:leukotriene-A4 hydrolase